MRKIIVFAMLMGGLVGLLRPSVAYAQTSVDAVKFVCGRQGPPEILALPIEPPVKPGNYATKISVELLSSPVCREVGACDAKITWNVSLAGQTPSKSASIGLTQLRTADIACENIVSQAFPSGGAPQFINGYVNLIAATTDTLAVTAVYTSQGCSFGQSGDSQGSSSCSGPVSIEVVPQQTVTVTVP